MIELDASARDYCALCKHAILKCFLPFDIEDPSRKLDQPVQPLQLANLN